MFAVVIGRQVGTELLSTVLPGDALAGMIHVGQDMHFRRQLRLGERVRTSGEVHSVRSAPGGAMVCTRLTTAGEDGADIVEMYSTILVRGLAAGSAAGPTAPDHRLSRERRGAAPASLRVDIDGDQTGRYAEASGDHNPIHLDEEFARAVGMQGVILHGLCSLAMCADAIVESFAAGDASRLRRVATRFLRPVYPGSSLSVATFGPGSEDGKASLGFSVRLQDRVVMTDGLVEIAAAG